MTMAMHLAAKHKLSVSQSYIGCLRISALCGETLSTMLPFEMTLFLLKKNQAIAIRITDACFSPAF